MSSKYDTLKTRLFDYENKKVNIVYIKYFLCAFLMNYCIENKINYFVPDISMFVDSLDINPASNRLSGEVKRRRVHKILREMKGKIIKIRKVHNAYEKRVQ